MPIPRRMDDYAKATSIADSDTLLGVVGGQTKQVEKGVLLSDIKTALSNYEKLGYISTNCFNPNWLDEQFPNTFMKQSDGSYMFTARQFLYNDGINFGARNEKVTISMLAKCGTGTSLRLHFREGTQLYGTSNFAESTTDFELIKLTSKTDNVDKLCFDWTGVGTFYIKDIKLEYGDTATPYTPYIPPNTEISAIKADLCANNAPAHNAIYRGKYLGDTLSDLQKIAIANGTFEDLYIGDYWTVGGVNYRIAGFDYWLRTGDTECTKHHVVIVPDTNLYTTKMNDTNITTGAYVGSKMYTDNLAQAKTIITNAFGSTNILSHREYLANATKATSNPTYESAGSWYDSTVELMNERMVYGADVFHNIEVNGAIPTNYTIDKSQLPLFALEPSRICNRANWWLRDVVSAAYFAHVNHGGVAFCNNASNSYGVRPAFGIVGN